jgi:hypothetical protein
MGLLFKVMRDGRKSGRVPGVAELLGAHVTLTCSRTFAPHSSVSVSLSEQVVITIELRRWQQ